MSLFQSKKEKLLFAAVLLLTLATFASTFSFGWVYDDPPQIPGNPDLRWERVGFLFTHHLWASAGASGITNARFYRPLLELWFLVNKTVFGLRPQWFHVTTVLLHLLATALAFFTARRLLGDATAAACAAAALFGVHPLQVESASWISAVNDPLAAVFCFASFLAYKKARGATERASSWWLLSLLCFVCALLTKEVSAVLPAILLVDLWCAGGETPAHRKRTAAVVLAAYGGVALLWLVIRRGVLGQMAAAASPISWTSALLTAPKILLFQLGHAILPAGLSPHYDFRALQPGAFAQVLLAVCVILALAVMAVFFARKSPVVSVAAAWLILPVLSTLNIRWLNEDDFVHDRYMYMSLLGAALFGGALFAELRRRWPNKALVPALATILIFACALASAIQSQYWSNDVVLFARGVHIAPNNEWAQLNYGAALSARGKFAEAAPHFAKSYESKAGWRAADYAAFAFLNSGQTEEAEHWYQQALQMNPALADAWFALGEIQLNRQRPADAIMLFQRAIASRPDAEGYHYALGSALEQMGQASAALEAYQLELRLHPSQVGARLAIERLNKTL